jgi:putative ABC transport system permease protein
VRPGFTLRMAWREGRSSLGRLLLYGGAIVMGVSALVAIHSFRNDVQRALDSEAQSLLGADVRVASTRPLPDSLTVILDSLAAVGVGSARVTTLVSMVLNQRSEGVRLLQVKAVDPGYPFYGDVRTDPRGQWDRLHAQPVAFVDPAVLIQLDARVGDTLSVGNARFVLGGTVTGLPTDLGLQTAVGPRLFISRAFLEPTGILTFGSLARYHVYIRMPEREDRDALWERYEDLLQESQLNYTTAQIQAQELTFAVDFLSRYLGLIGLAALLLGGIGVASAIHVYVRERLVSVAVLRCLGARQGTVFRAYLVQAALLGGIGSLVGVGLGIGIQHVLPSLLGGLIPVDVTPQVALGPVLAGALAGTWTSLIFALSPLLEIRGVPPLLALRHNVEPVRAARGIRGVVWGVLVVSVVGIAVLEAPSLGEGLAFAGGITVVGLVLWGTALALVHLTRRFLPSSAGYPIRQGLSNLFRPGNQTVAVTFALGFGAFIVGTVRLVEVNLARQFALEADDQRANLLLFDIQASQVESVLALLEGSGASAISQVPLVPARLTAINGESVDSLNTRPAESRPEGWALRREYRHTYREGIVDTEELIEGEWWQAGDAESGDGPGLISLETDLASSLRVGIGDRITWNVGGALIETEIANLRVVDWAQFAPNFFVVFEPRVLEDKPQTRLAFARIESETARAEFQRDLVRAEPNVSVLDLSRIQEAIDRVLARVNQAVRFLGVFSTLAGLFVLIGALATTRYQRMREGALLRTLGARKRVILLVLLSEYAALGGLAVTTGLGLSIGASWLLLAQVFGAAFVLPLARFVGLAATVAALTVVVGLLGSRGVLRSPPLVVLRSVQG